METRHALLTLILAIILVLSPMIAVGSSGRASSHTASIAPSPSQMAASTSDDIAQMVPPDPPKDVIGWESGYWYNESINIDQTNGLSESELDVFLARSMARVEHIRQLEFTEPITVEFVRREELNPPRNDTYGLSTSEQLWEALFIYGEQTNTSRAVKRAQRSVVLGYAAEEGSDHIVVVDPSPQKPTLNGRTLIHELAHMLQDQRFNLSRPRYQRHTLDGEFAKDGLIEGTASYLTAQYRTKCQGNWQCVRVPFDGGSGSRPAPLRFYHLTYFAYSTGEEYARTLIKQNGWKAVTAAHKDPPVATEQVIHPARNDQPIPISFTDTARNGWERVDTRPETLGEIGISTLFWRRSNSSAGTYDYVTQSSVGWGNDELYAYVKGDKHGYVWKTVWDTKRDARQFKESYIAVLKAEGATQQGPHTWRIKNGAFADYFSIRRAGNHVTIVNGPSSAALNDIHPARSNQSNMTTRTNKNMTNATTQTDGNTTQTTTATGPGFSGFTAFVALIAVTFTVIGLRNRN
jgi:hypothetical protein